MSDLAVTRRAVHGIAEHIVAAHGRRSGGSVRLFVTVRGFETRPPEADSLALADGMLIRRPDGPQAPLRGTFAELAAAVGLPFGMPDPPYPVSSGCGPDDPVTIDPDALALLVDAWARGAQALRLVAARRQLTDSEPALWPEHLDVGLAIGEVNLGVSPGDGLHDAPYAYVGPWTPRQGPFWNAPFGSLRPFTDLPDVEAVLGYFEQGLRAAADSAASRS